MFYIQINGINFVVREISGKKHSFSCKNINKVHCSWSGGAKNRTVWINIYANENNLRVSNRYAGFQELAKYILTQLEDGNIRSFAVSESCEKEIMRCASGEIYKRPKKG